MLENTAIFKGLWLKARGFSRRDHHDVASGRLPKRCYLCGQEEDWLLGLRKLIPIYGVVTKQEFLDDSSVWIWNSTETHLVDFADNENDCIREICAKPGCWFAGETEVNDVRTGEKVTIPACSSWRIVRLLRDFIIDGVIHGYAAMCFVGLGIRWIANWLRWRIYQMKENKK